MDFSKAEIRLLGCSLGVIRLGVPVSFGVRATHLQDNVQSKEAVGLGQASALDGAAPFYLYLSKGSKPSKLPGTPSHAKKQNLEMLLSSLLSLKQALKLLRICKASPQISRACLQAFLNGFSRRFDWWGRILIACLVEAYNCT